MRRSQFTNHLKALNEEELREELKTLFARIPEVKKYYAMELGSESDRQRLYDKAKKDISSKYATKSFKKPRRPRIQKINKILSDMKKKSIFSHEMVDLYLFDVECALDFIRKYDFFSTVLTNHIVKTFERATLDIHDLVMHDAFKDRCENILIKAEISPGIHIEMHDQFESIFTPRM